LGVPGRGYTLDDCYNGRLVLVVPLCGQTMGEGSERELKSGKWPPEPEILADTMPGLWICPMLEPDSMSRFKRAFVDSGVSEVLPGAKCFSYILMQRALL
jgi:hypothetical protein